MVDLNGTLLMQIVNFVILCAILGHFCYKPVLKVLDDRKARIKNEVTAMLNDRVNRYIDKNVVATSEFDILVEKLQIREIEPYSVVADIVGKVLR